MPQIIVIGIQPSYYFQNAKVLILSCGHKHIRPLNWEVFIGESFKCCFCQNPKD